MTDSIRVCICCKSSKPLENFNKLASGRLGRTSKCKACHCAHRREKYRVDESVREKCSRQSAKWVSTNKAKSLEQSRAWQAENRQRAAEYAREWRQSNPDRRSAQAALRRASKLQAVPTLCDDDNEFNQLFMVEAHRLAKLRTKLTGVPWHVDHRVPLNSEVVCGFHYFENIQVITAYENVRKSNIYWENMP